jgi:hypothetical protein
MIVFDFHGCLSLSSKDMVEFKNIIDFKNTVDFKNTAEFKNTNDFKNTAEFKNNVDFKNTVDWLNLKIDPYFLMPTLDDVIKFTENIKNKKQDIIFAIASMSEDENLMYDILKYCFECKNVKSPFDKKYICGGHFNDKGHFNNSGHFNDNGHFNNNFDKKELKIPHIKEILKRNNLNLDYSEIILIDDTMKIINYMRDRGIFSVYVKKYFTINEWNNAMK